MAVHFTLPYLLPLLLCPGFDATWTIVSASEDGWLPEPAWCVMETLFPEMLPVSIYEYARYLIKYSLCMWPIFLFLWDYQECCGPYDSSVSFIGIVQTLLSVFFFPQCTDALPPECIMHWRLPVYWYGTHYCGLINSCMGSLLWGDERRKSFWHASFMIFLF